MPFCSTPSFSSLPEATLKQLREHPILGRNATARRLNHVFNPGWITNGYDRPWLDACSTTTCLQQTEMVVRECDEFDDDYLEELIAASVLD